ncbi:MAG: kinase [Planctomycetes bacterium]|nr:kinase [Planctomycetota bacterium]MCB9868251.1 kinase [Planctomycetota bacterium]MCB9888773.1 kinase [Planctomycetota bacterium]
MIISRTPFRISFFGGGTDYPSWYREHGGAVLATTIDKYCYLTCRYLPPFFDYKYRVVWSQLENRRDAAEIEHPVVRCLLGHLGIERGVEVHHVGDLPARSGMGSSSAFTVGLLHGLHALQGRMVSKDHLMREAIHVEQNLLCEAVGSQDQVSAAVGGFNKLTFAPSGQIGVTPILLPPGRTEQLDGHLMLFYTGILRTAAQVAESYLGDLHAKRRQLRILRDLVDESIELLVGGGDVRDFGELLDEAWHVKRSLGAGVSTPEVDSYYRRAKAAGALGGKLTGAGGGGFLLLFVPPERQADVAAELAELVHVPFRFESSGSQIIFFDPEEDFSAVEAARDGRPVGAFRELADLPWRGCPIPYPERDSAEPVHTESPAVEQPKTETSNR